MEQSRYSSILVVLVALLALALPSSGWAQFNYTTNNDAITITGYTGLGGDVTIPSSTNGLPVTAIGDYAFYGQTALTGVTIPDSVTNIGNSAFQFCPSLANVTIPDSVASIGGQAFFASGLGSVTISSSVTSVRNGTFAYCSSLTNVTIPNSVTSIGDEAFYACFSLTNVTIGNSTTNIGNTAFEGCGLLNVTIPNSVSSIGGKTFSGCFSLTNVTIGNSVTNIGISAFSQCTTLHQAHFEGNAPMVNGGTGSADSTVFPVTFGAAYYKPGTTGWGATFGGWPTAQWYQPQPSILGSSYGLGVQSNGFQFTISWATNTSVVVETSTNLQSWTPLVTNALVSGTNAFADSIWTNYPQRFYRVRSQ